MASVKEQLVSGITYTALSKYAGIIISLVVTGILARLISPADFGVVAVATILIVFFGMLSDLGIAPAIVQNKELGKDEVSGIFSFTIWSGILLAVSFFLSSWAIADYYKNRQLLFICQLLSINLLFSAWNIVPNALLLQKKQFKFIAYRSLIIQAIGGTAAVVAALSGAGIYALLINPIFSSIVIFIVNYIKNPQKLKVTLAIHAMRKIFSFSVYQFLFNIINYFSRSLDKLLIGKYTGLSMLGYYEKSYRLMMLPLENITHVITPVMHPVFSELQHDFKNLSGSYLKIIRILAFLGFSLSAFLWFNAEELILLIFGNQWGASVPVFRILSLTVGVQIILSTSGSIFQAANDTKSMFISGLLSSITTISGILVGIFFFKTLEAVAWCICAAFIINFLQCYFLMYKVTFKMNMLPFWKQFSSPLTLCLILTSLLFPGSKITEQLDLLIRFIIKGFILISTVAAYIQLTGEFNIISRIKSFLVKQ